MRYKLRNLLPLLLLTLFSVNVGHGHAQASAKPATVAAPAQLVDLNSATPAQLKMLPGIGDAFAKRIVEGRPYTSKNQLLSKGILPGGTYDKIKASVIARQTKP